MNVLTSITVLGFLIFFHEMGHFLAAILQGIYVDGFSIGFGPSIIQKKYKDITYSFRAFPLAELLTLKSGYPVINVIEKFQVVAIV